MKTPRDLRRLIKHAGPATGILALTCQYLEGMDTEEEFLAYLKNHAGAAMVAGVLANPTNEAEREALAWFMTLTPDQRLTVVAEAYRFGKLLNGES